MAGRQTFFPVATAKADLGSVSDTLTPCIVAGAKGWRNPLGRKNGNPEKKAVFLDWPVFPTIGGEPQSHPAPPHPRREGFGQSGILGHRKNFVDFHFRFA